VADIAILACVKTNASPPGTFVAGAIPVAAVAAVAAVASALATLGLVAAVARLKMDSAAWAAVAAVVSALATLILVGVTVYYARQTKRTVEEMQKNRELTRDTIEEMRKSRELTGRTVEEMVTGRELALIPMVVCRLVVDHERAQQEGNYPGSAVLSVAADHTTLLLTNVGNAPALAVEVRANSKRPDGSGRLYLAPFVRGVGIMGPAMERSQRLTFKQNLRAGMSVGLSGYINPNTGDSPVTVDIVYTNAYGRRFESRTTFDLGNDEAGVAWRQQASSVTPLSEARAQGAPRGNTL